MASRWNQRGNDTEDSGELQLRGNGGNIVSGFLETRIMDGSSVSGG